ncbi:hypothetical protein GCM10027085_01170 [Spirosoma aerophilum]
MIDYSHAIRNKQQLSDHLTCLSQLFPAKGFRKPTPFTHQSQVQWIELICMEAKHYLQSLPLP